MFRNIIELCVVVVYLQIFQMNKKELLEDIKNSKKLEKSRIKERY